MSENFQVIIDSYIQWIRDNTSLRSVGNGSSSAIVTPFLDRHNDHVEIYATKKDGGYKLTDDGQTIKDLEMSGMEISSPKRQKVLNTTLNGFGVKLGEDQELYVETNLSNLGQKKHFLIQAILAVNDMYALSQEHIFSFFKEDVELYFKSNEIIHTKDVKITGKTGFHHNIDFIVSASKTRPERLIKTINNPKKDQVIPALFMFNDIKEIREQETKSYLIYNNIDYQPSSEILDALSSYDVHGIPWSEKDVLKKEMALN